MMAFGLTLVPLLLLLQASSISAAAATKPIMNADLFNLDAYEAITKEKVPENVRLSIKTLFQSEHTQFSSRRPGNAVDSYNCDRISSVPRHLTFITRYGFYAKYLHAYGIPIVSSNRVKAAALKRACHIVRFLFADRRDVRQSMYKLYGRFGVMAETEGTTTIPEFRNLPAWWNQRARGLGGMLSNPISTGGEENILCLASDRYRGEEIFFHESAHGVAEVALRGGGIPGYYRRLESAYNNARRRGLWRNTYAMTDSREYFAEGLQSFFNNNRIVSRPDGIHNLVNSREKLLRYDPTLYNLIKEVYPCMNTYKTCQTAFFSNIRTNCDGTTKPSPPVPATTKSVLPTKCVITYETVQRNTNCYDRSSNCRSWSQRGECTRNPSYMSTSCCRSCKGGGSCSDKNGRCSGWASRGECRRNPAYMNVNCKKSCNLCSSGKKKIKKCWTVTTQKPLVTVMPPLPEETTVIPPLPEVKTTTVAPPPTEGPGGSLKPPPIPQECDSTMAAGIETKRIPDDAMTSSSSLSSFHSASQGRLNAKASDKSVGAWCAAMQDRDQYLEVDIGAEKTIKSVKVQGRPDGKVMSYVKKFIVEYSDNSGEWYQYVIASNIHLPKLFDGNTDNNSIKTVNFDVPFVARHVRIKPQMWNNMICMRLELFYCK